jgi:hypothetical protein
MALSASGGQLGAAINGICSPHLSVQRVESTRNWPDSDNWSELAQ